MSSPDHRPHVPSIAEGSKPTEAPKREFPGVREIISSPKGWSRRSVRLEFSPLRPQREMWGDLARAVIRTNQERVIKVTQEGGKPDFDSPKVWLRKVSEDPESGDLMLTTGLTTYFTLWGLPGAAPQLHERFLSELPTHKETEVPNGVVTHNTIITKDKKVMMAVRSKDVGFSAGRVSTTFEEQMEPKDSTPFRTAVRGLEEEFGISVSSDDAVTLLGLAAEKGSAYTAFCYIVEVDKTAEEIAKAWKTAPDKSEGSALFAVPIENIDVFAEDEIPFDVWSGYKIAGDEIAEGTTLNPHPVVPWRIEKVKDYLGQKSKNATIQP